MLTAHDLSHLDAYQAAARLVAGSAETPAFTLQDPAAPAAGPGPGTADPHAPPAPPTAAPPPAPPRRPRQPGPTPGCAART